MRHTKIIATIGPASDSDSVLDLLIAAGMDVARLNFSHGSHESHAATYARVREAAARAGREVAILQDLSGPKIRTGPLEGGRTVSLAPGDPLTIGTGDFAGGPGRVSTTFDGLARGVRAGDRLLLADGTIELRVDDVEGSEIRTTVVEGGLLGEHKGQRARFFAEGIRDHAQGCRRSEVRLALGVEIVRGARAVGGDVVYARELIVEAGRRRAVVAKLERPQELKC